ncbi:hypothetical protein Agabi119p4_8060 [Agaricus bisporus var. burnettii]|uniref:FAD/NAD(P)-binding domain-containing protein n=1 Tax=Agaricus bisporus var. burnettii TaxID=192524 RepID=A0A8H7C798_AGABI|nr:hypothetical protein Agabi119p4_8060 [Agaricus bisporus var. burnettii]
MKQIGIIGAGPAGLAALKSVLDCKAANWRPIVFESREEVGGVWFPSPADAADPPLTPLYDSLTANLPHPLMGYRSFLFPPETPLFPKAEVVHQYLKDFTSHFSLRPHIKFSTSVTSVKFTPEQSRRWLVETSTQDSYYFDLIMVCTGHFRFPLYPSIPGISDWLEAKKASHSVYYRHPLPAHKDKTILVVGTGPSGVDLARDLHEFGCKVLLSGSANNLSVTLPSSIQHRPHLASLDSPSDGIATYTDGTMDKGIDYCFLATGYKLHFPFLQPPLLQNTYPKPIPPLPSELYNSSYSLFPLAQHLWPLQNQYPPESIAFFGLVVKLAPLPVYEAQARAVLHAFHIFDSGIEEGTGARGIDKQTEAVDIVTRWEYLKQMYKGDERNVIKLWHQFEETEQFAYRDHLAGFVQTDPSRVEDWEYEAYQKKILLRTTWVKIEKSGQADKWLKDVGKDFDFDHPRGNLFT